MKNTPNNHPLSIEEMEAQLAELREEDEKYTRMYRSAMAYEDSQYMSGYSERDYAGYGDEVLDEARECSDKIKALKTQLAEAYRKKITNLSHLKGDCELNAAQAAMYANQSFGTEEGYDYDTHVDTSYGWSNEAHKCESKINALKEKLTALESSYK